TALVAGGVVHMLGVEFTHGKGSTNPPDPSEVAAPPLPSPGNCEEGTFPLPSKEAYPLAIPLFVVSSKDAHDPCDTSAVTPGRPGSKSLTGAANFKPLPFGRVLRGSFR